MKRSGIIIAVCLALLLVGCRTYTPEEGMAAIEPIDSIQEPSPLITKPSELARQRQQEAEESELEQARRTVDTLRQALDDAQTTIGTLQKQKTDIQEELDEKLADEAQKKQQQEDEEARRAAEEQARKAKAEAEARQIPSFEEMTYPRTFHTDEAIITAQPGDTLTVLFLPLSDAPWVQAEEQAKEVIQSIEDIDAQLIFLTGDMHNVIEVIGNLHRSATFFANGAIVSRFAMGVPDETGMTVSYTPDEDLRLSLADLPEYSVMQAFLTKQDWKQAAEAIRQDRMDRVASLLQQIPLGKPAIVASSLYEPSHRDWNSFSPVPYRQTDYRWPLSELFEQEGFLDTYRTTHFSETTDAGNTLQSESLKERIDFLYTRDILPLDSSVVTMGPESVATSDTDVVRYGIIATYLVP